MSTKNILLHQLEVEQMKRKDLQIKLQAANGQSECDAEESKEATIAKLAAELSLIDTVIAECEVGLKDL